MKVYCIFLCKEWGFFLRKLFGMYFGIGDYGYLFIDYSVM